jgi:hypothetical protein
MSKARNNPHKRKLRQKEVRKRVLERREEIRAERKKLHEELVKERSMHELEHGKIPELLPGNSELAEKRLAEREQKNIDKLRKNLEVLKQLEEEYDREQSSRQGVNSQLESEGFKTIKEKMDALQQKLHKYALENADPSAIDGMQEDGHAVEHVGEHVEDKTQEEDSVVK